MKKFNLVALLLLVFSANLFAQEEAVKDLLNDYIKAVNNLPKSKNTEDVTQLFHENYVSYTAEIGMSGIVHRKTADLKEYEERLQNIIEKSDYKLKLSVDKILYSNQKNREGTVAALINFENKYQDKIADKGTILLTIIASKVTGEWKIMHSNITRISESKDIGKCSCNIYKKGEDSLRYLAEVFYPSGLEIAQSFATYRIAYKNGKRLIISDNDDYIWDELDDIYLGKTKIGKTDDIKEAIRLISKHKFNDNCTEMIKI